MYSQRKPAKLLIKSKGVNVNLQQLKNLQKGGAKAKMANKSSTSPEHVHTQMSQ
jgi:hypothetical protein